MKISREHVKRVFQEYTDLYDSTDEKIRLKIYHTYRVAEICERIAQSLSLSKEDVDLAWLLGMLHDVGRFEQLKRYGTFSDAQSIDHAHFGVELLYAPARKGQFSGFAGCGRRGGYEAKRLASYPIGSEKLTDLADGFRENEECFLRKQTSESPEYFEADRPGRVNQVSEIAGTGNERNGIFLERFVEIASGEEAFEIIRTAIWNHSAYRIEEGLDERMEMFCHILRDADKVDIFKVCQDTPIEVIYNVSTEDVKHSEVTDEVMKQFFEKHAILRGVKKTPADCLAGYAALAFELVYPESVRIAKEQGYLKKILDFRSENERTVEQFEKMRKFMEENLGSL